MNPSWHIFLGFLFSVFLLFLFPEVGVANLSLIFLASVLIDVDHYLFYIYEKKGFNLRKAYSSFMEQKRKCREFGRSLNYGSSPSFFIFHGLEVLLLLFVFSFIFKFLYFIFIGFSFHLLLDLVEQAAYSSKSQKISVVNDFLNYKR
jgi:hypothetical protein